MDYVLISLVFVFLILPGLILGPILLRKNLGLFASLVIGAGLGLVILLDIDAMLSALGGITILNLLLAIGLLSVTALIAFTRMAGLSSIRGKIPWGIISIIVGGVLVRSLPLLKMKYPLGWDATFHLLIAKSSLATGKIPQTWQPYERFALNYPWGSHLLIANISIVSGAQLHTIFMACSIVIFSALSIAAIYVLAGRLGFSRNAMFGSAFAYAFLASSGSIDYFRWGGLPNQIAMFLFICCIIVFISNTGPRFMRLLISGFMLSGVVLVHHHSMITAFAILLFIAIIACVSKRRICGIGYDAVIVLGIALLASFSQSWKLISKIGESANVGAFQFKETLNVFTTPFIDVGIVLIICSVIGLSYIYRDTNESTLFLHGWTTALFVFFTIGYYLWRIYSRLTIGEVFVAMTPSRFLADMAYPLSVYAGLFLSRFMNNRRLSGYAMIGLLLMIPVYYISGQMRPPFSSSEADALEWLRSNTAETSLIVNEGSSQYWIPYISEREVTLTPIPISEQQDKYKEMKIILSDCVQDRKLIKDNLEVYDSFKDRDVYVYNTGVLEYKQLKEVFMNDAARIYKVDWRILKART